MLITDAEARITYVNAAFERNSGYRSPEVLGLNPRFLKSGAQSPTFFDAMWAAITNGLPWVAEMTNRRKDGSLYHLASVISPIRAADRSISGFVSVGRDVSRERELETQTDLLTRERALIADTLRRLPSGATLEVTAELFCRQVRSLSGVSVTSLIIFEADGLARPDSRTRRRTSATSDFGATRRAGASISATAPTPGPWVESWRGHLSHPYDESFRNAGIQAIRPRPGRGRWRGHRPPRGRVGRGRCA